jgi:hypothetical protein
MKKPLFAALLLPVLLVFADPADAVDVQVRRDCLKSCKDFPERHCCKESCDYQACVADKMKLKVAKGGTSMELVDPGAWSAAMAACYPFITIIEQCGAEHAEDPRAAKAEPPAAKESGIDLSGEWGDDWGYTIKLTHSGGSITGTFSKGSNVGRFTGGSLEAQTCKVTLSYTEPWKESEGKVDLTLSEDGQTMRGGYVSNVPGYSAPQRGGWTFYRKGESKGGCKGAK